MAAPIQTLEDWLSERLLAENPEVDLEIFVPYVTGILDTDTSTDDKRESLEEVLEQVVESGQEKLCRDIIDQWEARNKDQKEEPDKDKSLELKLSKMLVGTNVAVVKTRVLTEEEKARKAAIIAQYEELSDGEGDGKEDDAGAKAGAKAGAGAGAKAGAGAGAISGEDWMTRNVNSLSVLEAEKDKRDKSKLEHERKKEKDRLDRDAQKQKQQDRKEGEKKRTQKGEKRR